MRPGNEMEILAVGDYCKVHPTQKYKPHLSSSLICRQTNGRHSTFTATQTQASHVLPVINLSANATLGLDDPRR